VLFITPSAYIWDNGAGLGRSLGIRPVFRYTRSIRTPPYHHPCRWLHRHLSSSPRLSRTSHLLCLHTYKVNKQHFSLSTFGSILVNSSDTLGLWTLFACFISLYHISHPDHTDKTSQLGLHITQYQYEPEVIQSFRGKQWRFGFDVNACLASSLSQLSNHLNDLTRSFSKDHILYAFMTPQRTWHSLLRSASQGNSP
jgi:hypothetical protein